MRWLLAFVLSPFASCRSRVCLLTIGECDVFSCERVVDLGGNAASETLAGGAYNARSGD